MALKLTPKVVSESVLSLGDSIGLADSAAQLILSLHGARPVEILLDTADFIGDVVDMARVGVYTRIYTNGGAMETAKLFKNGRSQAVRLPRKYSLPGQEVYIKKLNGVVMLIPKDEDPWKLLVDSLEKFSDDFYEFERDQGNLEKRTEIE
jgi:antitoxin VapB